MKKYAKVPLISEEKKIKKSLENVFDNPEIELEKLKIDYNKRPEQLTVDEFFKISTIMK